MMYIVLNHIVLILCFSLTIVVITQVKAFSPFERRVQLQNLVVFGDSHSDNGNVYTLTNQATPIPPYWNGRYSNGPNWVDQLGILEITDYAYGGATTDNDLVQGYAGEGTVPVPGILQQVEIYLNNTDVNTTDFSSTLYIIWGGGNDFTFDQTLLPNVIVVSLVKSVQALLNIGARNILVFNQIPSQYLPFTKPFNIPELFIFLTNEANYYGSILMKAAQFDNPEASLKIFDIHALFLEILTENSSNLTNTVDNCWINNGTTIVQLCNNINEYFFVDLSHFTTRVHGLIADAVRSFILDSYEVYSQNSAISSIPKLNFYAIFIFLYYFS